MEKLIRRFLTILTLALLTVTAACATVTGSSPGVSTSGTSTVTRAGATVTATAAGGGAHHGGGLVLNTQAPPVPTTILSGSLPSSVDLDRYNPPVADEATEALCTPYATGYYLRGWYANRDGYYPPSGFSVGFIYDQVPKDANGYTTFSDNLTIQDSEGLDTQGDYFEPKTADDTDVPVPYVPDSVLTNAARYKIRGYTDHTKDDSQAFVNYIKRLLADQVPVAIGIYTSPQFDNLSSDSPSDLVSDTSKNTGAHAVYAYGYDQNGLLIENEWGTDWGYKGYAELSWKYVETFGHEVVSIDPLPPTAPTWQKLPGAATAIAVGANGSVWALGTTPVTGGYGIYHWDPKTWTWNVVSGAAVRIAVDVDGNPWVVNNAGNIFKWDGRTWQQLPGAARDIAISKSGVVWIVTATASGKVQCPAGGCANSVLDVDNVSYAPRVKCQPSVCDGSVNFWTGSAWKQFGGTANRIAVDAEGYPWVVSTSGDLSHYVPPPPPGFTQPTPTPGPADWVSVPLPVSAKALAVPARAPIDDPSDQTVKYQKAWAIDTDGVLFKSNERSGQWNIISGPAAVAVAASPLGGAWVVGANGYIYELPSWEDR